MLELERFMQKVRKHQSGCWLWNAYCLPRGYGLFWLPMRHELAHRAAYRLFVGPLESGAVVYHTCDTPACVNPDHLRLGTQKDNMQDAAAKGRTARGEGHGRANLSAEQVKFAIKSPLLQREVAEILGTSQGYISELRSGKKRIYLSEENVS